MKLTSTGVMQKAFKMDFDEIFEYIGDFGTYQRMIVYIVLLPTVAPCAFHAYNQIFMSAKPNYYCKESNVIKEDSSILKQNLR